MESGHENGSRSVDLRTGVTSNLGEDENFNPRKEQLESSSSPSTSQNHFHFMPNTTPHHNGATTSPTSEFHNTSEKGDGSKISSHLEAYHATNPFGERHNSQFGNNNSAFSSHNPFLLPCENLQQENGVSIGNSFFSTHHNDDDSFNGEMLSSHSSPLGNNNNNPFEVQTTSDNTLNCASFSHNFDVVDDDENHYHRHESLLHHNHEQKDWRIISKNNNTIGDESHVTSSNQHLDPFFTFEEESSTQKQKLANPTQKTHESANFSTNIEPNHSMDSRNLGTDSITVPHETKNLGTSKSSFSPASKSSTLDPIHNSSIPPSKMKEKSPNLDLDSSDYSDDHIPISSSMQNHGSETQNPPIQVMERTGNNPATTTTTTSKYRIPSHVFARNKSKTEWSTASNESLFSIQMGNISFSREISWYNKSGELYNNKSSELHMSDPLGSNNQHPLPPQQPQLQPQTQQQSPVNKFSDMSQISAEQNEGWRVTEEKAAETMREVIMEESLRKEGLSNEAPSLYFRHCDASDHSNHSNGSTKSFAFKISTDGDRTLSSKHVEELTQQQKQIQQQTIIKETPNAVQTTKSTINNNNNNNNNNNKNNNNNNNNAPQSRWLSCFTCCNN